MSRMAAAAGEQREPGSARGRPGGALRVWSMLYAWSPRLRLVAALVIAVLAGASMSGACIVWDPLGVHGARAALADAQKRLDDARLAVARLPALRGAAARTAPRAPYKGNSADDIRRVSQLAAQAALVLHALEPGAGGGARAEAFRSIKLVAQGSFAQWCASPCSRCQPSWRSGALELDCRSLPFCTSTMRFPLCRLLWHPLTRRCRKLRLSIRSPLPPRMAPGKMGGVSPASSRIGSTSSRWWKRPRAS